MFAVVALKCTSLVSKKNGKNKIFNFTIINLSERAVNETMTNFKPVAAIHDLSGVGRCSLTVIIPALSALGVQCCPIPTAVFSTHTGGLGPVVKEDLTHYLLPTLAHYQSLDLEFGGIYTGYLSSEHQVDHCLKYMEAYPNALHIVDPVMGDHGKAYKAYTPAMQERMKELVAKAEVITPNFTEACLLLGIPYTEQALEVRFLKEILIKLSKLGPKCVIITGLKIESSDKLVNAGYDSITGMMHFAAVDRVPAAFPGTGDLFASIITGELVKGSNLQDAMAAATAFSALAVKVTHEAGTDTRYGVLLEPVLSKLIDPDTRTVEFLNV